MLTHGQADPSLFRRDRGQPYLAIGTVDLQELIIAGLPPLKLNQIDH